MVRGTARSFFVLSRRAALFSATAVLCVSCSSQDRPQGRPEQSPPTVREQDEVQIQEASRQFLEVEEVTAASTGSTVTASAKVDFRDGAVSQIGPPLDGRVTTIHAFVGQRVHEGDPLLTLNCPDAADRRAAAAVAQTSLREARMELDRQHRMQQEGVGIERDLVAAETKVSAAEAEVSRAEAGIGSIGNGAGADVVVRSPIDGVVIERKASVGLAVQRGGDPLVQIGNASALWIVADVFERDLAHVRTGAKAQVTFASTDHSIDARVASVGAVVAASLRTAPVYLTIDAKGMVLRPGMYGRVEIDSSNPGMTLPVTAVLIKDGREPVVYVQKDRLTFIRRRVIVGSAVAGRVPILSGLSPGEKVVVRGALLLDGSAEQLL
jgi:membrane fusion protein, heavy metal efflux system